jgi:aryl-alcohol dehydrogenase-like predicted oxidoreductase
MERRKIPACGLEVSVVGIGCNNFGGRNNPEQTKAIIHAAIDLGITLFDTADVYTRIKNGSSEEMLGQFLGDRRKDVVIATKFGIPFNGDSRKSGGSRRYITQAVEDSLRRLKTDWIDLYQMHKPDPSTPIEETLRALDGLIRDGKVRYIGCSNYAGWQIAEAEFVAREIGTNRFVSNQSEYSLLNRDVEAEILPPLQKYGMGFLPYFPLASGVLTGKYRPGQAGPAGTRLSGGGELADHFLKDDYIALADQLRVFAESRGHSLLELAFSWLASKPVIWSVIAGASSPAQLEQNVKAASWKLSADDFAEVGRILKGNGPEH